MKVLGIASEGYNKKVFICEVSSSEIAKIADKAGYRDTNPADSLKPGDEYPIDQGYDFRAEIVAATKDMERAYASFQKAAGTMTRFAVMVSEAEAQTGEAE